jgi:hypothetical protein
MALTKRLVTVRAAECSSFVACSVEAPACAVAELDGEGAEADGDGLETDPEGAETDGDGVVTEADVAEVDVDGADESVSLEPPQAGASARSARTAPRMARRMGMDRVVKYMRTCTTMNPLSHGTAVPYIDCTEIVV